MSETDRDFVSRMHDKHLRCEAMSFDDGNRVFALALSGAEAAALTAENERLRVALWDIHAVCNNWDWFIWMWPIRRIKRFARAALKEGGDE